MLCAILNKPLKQHPTKQQLYGHPTSHLTNHQVKTKTDGVLLEKKRWTHKWHSFMDSYTWIHLCWLTNKISDQLCVDTGSSLEDLPGIMNDRDGWQERGRKLCAVSTTLMMMMYSYLVLIKKRSKDGDPKAPFSIATKPRCKGGHYSIPWIAPLYPWSLPYNTEW